MQLLQWQWSNYASAHRDRWNLLIHLVTAPIFAVGLALLPIGALAGSLQLAAAGFALVLAAIVVQARGHAREGQSPAPFRGPRDFVLRLTAEQLITFPRFVLSGRFLRAMRESAAAAGAASAR